MKNKIAILTKKEEIHLLDIDQILLKVERIKQIQGKQEKMKQEKE